MPFGSLLLVRWGLAHHNPVEVERFPADDSILIDAGKIVGRGGGRSAFDLSEAMDARVPVESAPDRN